MSKLITDQKKIRKIKMKLSARSSKISSGFTLVELIVVMAVIAILAAITIAGINPSEQLARGRDTSRISAVVQIGKALQNYYAVKNSLYPTASTWTTDLTSAKELSLFPTVPSGIATGCTAPTGGSANLAGANSATTGSGYCYKNDGAGSPSVVVYTALEAAANNSKCTTGQVAWAIWSSTDGRAGIVCTANATTEPSTGAQTFVGNP